MSRAPFYSAAFLVASAVALSASPALAHAGDAAATREYLQLDLKRTRAEVTALPTALGAIAAFRGQLQAECAGVLASEPPAAAGEKPSSSTEAIGDEVTDAAFGAAERTEYQLHRSFARAVSRLAWSDRALTRLVHAHAAEELARTQISPPSLCADLRVWVAGGYRSVSAATTAYVDRESTLSAETGGVEEVILRKLVPDESAADKLLAREIAAVERRALNTILPKVAAALDEVREVLDGSAPAS